MRADSGFYAHAVVAMCRRLDVRFSITVRQHKGLRALIEAIPEAAWTPIPYWIDGGADVAETTYTPFADEKDAIPVRLIVRRVRPTPGSQLALFALYDYHAFITDRDGETLVLEADHRRHAEIENAIRDLKYGVGLNHLPSGQVRRQRRLAGGAGDRPQPRPLDGPDRPGRGDRHDEDAPPAAVRPAGPAHPLGPPGHAPPAGPLALGGSALPSPSRGCGPSPSRPDRRLAAPGPGLSGACPLRRLALVGMDPPR